MTHRRLYVSRLVHLGWLALILLSSVLLPLSQIPTSSCVQGDFAPCYAQYSLEFGGQTRTFWLFIPSDYADNTPMPLVVGLHGGGGSQFQHSSDMNAHAETLGFIAVYPDGTSALPTWNAGHCCGAALRQNVDDVGFMRADRGTASQSRV